MEDGPPSAQSRRGTMGPPPPRFRHGTRVLPAVRRMVTAGATGATPFPRIDRLDVHIYTVERERDTVDAAPGLAEIMRWPLLQDVRTTGSTVKHYAVCSRIYRSTYGIVYIQRKNI